MTIKAIRIHAYGGPDVLRYEDVDDPVAGVGEVIVRIAAAGVNPVDWKVREGYLATFVPYTLPLIPGFDFSGTVATIGEGVTAFAPGDEVFGAAPFEQAGAYAQAITVPASILARKPASLDIENAAAIPTGAITAWQGLFAPDYGNLQKGQTVLIHGGAGGVGIFAVQLAKWRGARVITTASANNAEFLLGLGADEVIDYGTQRFEDIVHDVDLVFDLIGGDVQARSWKVLRKGGLLASAVGEPSAEEAAAHGVRAVAIYGRGDGELLGKIAALVDDGTLKVIVSQVLPLEEAAQALDISQAGHVRGKILLRPQAG